MTIFARRRLQVMLDELAPRLTGGKGKDILRRLNDKKNVDQALPAEMELALLWAIHSLGDLEVEPEWWGDAKRPDAITDDLVEGHTVAIEIAAPNDNALSGEQAMDAIALQISTVASQVKKGAGNFLRYRFQEESVYEAGRYIRRRLAPEGFRISDELSVIVQNWVRSGQCSQRPLRHTEEGLDVQIELSAHKQTRFHNISSSMPPEAFSLEDNPLYELMKRKKRQLRAAAPGTLRMIFLADVGSTLLRRIGRSGEFDHSRRRVSGQEIISHFLSKNAADVDAVVAFAPHKELPSYSGIGLLGYHHKPKRWDVTFFGTPAQPTAPPALDRLASSLPDPHYEGYQARSLFRQGAFSPERRGQYLGMTIKGSGAGKNLSVEFPARMLLDLLAGRMTEQQFRANLTQSDRNPNIFAAWLDRGMTISKAEMAPRNVDEDDDHLILHFSDDPAARPFVLDEP